MGLAVRVIPTLLKRGDKLVKGRQFSADRVVGHVMQAAKVHQARGVDELIIIDVDAHANGGPDLAAIAKLTEDCFMPLTVAGGVTSVSDVAGLLRAGADKVAVCSCAPIIDECSSRFGCQAMVAAIDYKGEQAMTRNGKMSLPRPHGYDTIRPETVALWLESIGAGEILLTSIEREGMMCGYDLEMIERVSNLVSIPVIAHGGCSGPDDMLRAIDAGASAVAAGALFQFTDWTPLGCSRWLAEHGVEARI
jgi:cyclase